MLAYRLRRWPDIKTPSFQRLMHCVYDLRAIIMIIIVNCPNVNVWYTDRFVSGGYQDLCLLALTRFFY